MENAINWFAARRGRVTYSMERRYGPSSYDCSSAVYYALIEGGIFPQGTRIGNTETLFVDLEKYGFVQLPADAEGNVETRRGDVFIWGGRGHSLGAAGHTGIMVDGDNIIHCNYGHNGISVNNHDQIWEINGCPPYTFYRHQGKPAPAQPLERKAISGIHTVEFRDVQHGIEQVLSPTLYGANPTWEDNGIPVTAINKVDNDGYWLSGKTMPGEKFIVPGLFVVKERSRDETNGKLYALLDNVGGHEVWVLNDILTDAETNRPNPRPNPQPELPPAEPEKPKEEQPAPKEPKAPEQPAPPEKHTPEARESVPEVSLDKNSLTILGDIKKLLQSLLDALKSIFRKG